MKAKYPHVYDPFEIRGVWFKNRLQQTPPGCFFAGDERGFVTDLFVKYFRQYAKGGVAVCEVGNCSIDITESSDEPGQLRLDPVWNYRENREAEPPYLRPLPHILMAVDEYAYFMLSDSLRSEFESSVSYITARGRETGIHLMLRTGHPREEIITGRIKSCFPARIVTGLASSFESRLVLGIDGGEKLPPGSMLAKLGPGYGTLTELKSG